MRWRQPAAEWCLRASAICSVVALVVAAAVSVVAPAASASDDSRVGAGAGDVRMWQFDHRGSRFNGAERALTAANVHRLRLKWAFAVPRSDGAQSSQPAVVGDTIFFGGRNGVFYALNAKTGRQRWRFDTEPLSLPPAPGAILNPLRDGPAVADGIVYFGDSRGFVYALDVKSGALRWMTRVGDHPNTTITSSPLVYNGRVFVGVSSNEEASAIAPTYPCCTFRGSFVALSANTGQIIWRYWTIPQPQFVGLSSFGVPQFAPSGGAVWSSPAIDPRTGTLFIGTGNTYTGEAPNTDSMIALDSNNGTPKWIRQLTSSDTWNFQCLILPGVGNCPTPGPDFDFGSQPNVLEIDGRTVVGEGQKSGVYHLLDAVTGQIIWQTMLRTTPPSPTGGGLDGIQWGASFDGTRLYVSTNQAQPGTLFALDPRTGGIVWHTPNPANGCTSGGALTRPAIECKLALPNAVTSTPGLVWEGSQDGKMRAYSSLTGRILWTYDTVRVFRTVNHVFGMGGSMDGGGAVVSNGMMYTNSGYRALGIPFTEMSGNVVLAFGLS